MCVPSLAHSAMVAPHVSLTSKGTLDSTTISSKSSFTQPCERGSSSSQKTKVGDMSIVRGYYQAQGLHDDTVSLIMKSWRAGTKAQYTVYLKEFCLYFKEKGDPFQPTLENGIKFLTALFNRGFTYNQIAMARSALSAVIDMKSPCGLTFGKHLTVKRLMKGIFETNPIFPKYSLIWDVNKLFTLFRNLDAPDKLSMDILGKKLAILIAILAGGQRSQTLHKINIADIRILHDQCVIPIYDKIKQTKPGKHMKPMEFRVYLREPKLCIVENLKEYLKRPFLIERIMTYSLATISLMLLCLRTQSHDGVETS